MFIKDTQFYKTFVVMTAMIAVQNLLAFGVNLADNLMLGRYSETSIAAASLVNQIQFLLQMMSVNGIGTGALLMVSQYWGKGETEPCKRIIALAMKFAAVLGAFFCSVTFFWPEAVLGLLTNQSAVKAEAVLYMRFMCFSFLTFPLQSALVMSLRGVRTVYIGPAISVVSLAVNVTFNYMFIYGNWGAPEMGIEGAAVATLIARVFELLIVLAYVRFFDRKLRLSLLSFFKPDAFYLGDFTRTALPVIASGASWGIGMMMQTAILGRLSASVIAANSVTAVVYQVFCVYSFGACSTSNVMMGNIVGAGQMELVRPYSRTFQMLFIINGLITGLLLFLTRDIILSFYVLSPETEELTRVFMTILCVMAVFASYQFPAASGIVLGGGNTRYPVIVETLFIWMWVLPMSALSAFVLRWPPVVTFILLKSDQVLKCIPNGIVVNRYRWVRTLTR